jgi:hypothetical protein
MPRPARAAAALAAALLALAPAQLPRDAAPGADLGPARDLARGVTL